LFIYADQIKALPAAICRALIRFLCVQVNLLCTAPFVHSQGKYCGNGRTRDSARRELALSRVRPFPQESVQVPDEV